jgi:hypothetical protein
VAGAVDHHVGRREHLHAWHPGDRHRIRAQLHRIRVVARSGGQDGVMHIEHALAFLVDQGPKDRKQDGIYRALKRGRSTFMRRKVERVAEELRRDLLVSEPGKARLLATRSRVVEEWSASATLLRAQGQESLARGIEAYVRRMPAVATEKELVAKGLIA